MTTELDAALDRARMLTDLLERERLDHEITAADRDRCEARMRATEARVAALDAAARAVVAQHLGTEGNELWCTWCDHAGWLGDENVHRPDCAMGALAALLEDR